MVSVDVKHHVYLHTSTFCFTSTEARWLIRDGDGRPRPGGKGGGGRKSEGSTAETARKTETGETVNRRQNNGSVKAVTPRHCPAASALPC